MTKSANDIAVTVAENIGGVRGGVRRDDDAQGAPARHVAHHLLNASGLPDPAPGDHRARPRRPSAAPSRTASRSTTPTSRPAASATRGAYDRNHNKLLGRVEGIDGIKTGYTRMSGFNLLTSVHSGRPRTSSRVVLGGRSGRVARPHDGRASSTHTIARAYAGAPHRSAGRTSGSPASIAEPARAAVPKARARPRSATVAARDEDTRRTAAVDRAARQPVAKVRSTSRPHRPVVASVAGGSTTPRPSSGMRWRRRARPDPHVGGE